MTSEAQPIARLYEVQVSLRGNVIPVTRNIVLSNDTPLYDLHFVIQAVMGWDDCHLHMFIGTDGAEYGNPDILDDMDVYDEGSVAVRDLLRHTSNSFRYFYDFGDGWDHDVTLIRAHDDEDSGSIGALCVAGSGACPPEDCGGIGGYARCVDAMSNPSGDYDHEWLAWVRARMPEDVHAFDVSEANRTMRTLVRRDGRLAWPDDGS